MKNFLLFCSGANHRIITNKRCQLDIGKQQAIGATILLTAIFASLSGGYAFYTVFKHIGIAVMFSLLWGVTIFNLDRLLVMSTQKQSTFRWHTLASYSTRFLIAFIIAIVVAAPLELRLFQDTINVKIDTSQVKESKTYEASLSENADIQSLKKQQAELKILIGDRQEKLDQGRQEYTERLGQYGQSSIVSISVDHQNQEMQRELNDLNLKEEKLLSTIQELESKKDRQVTDFKTTQNHNRSIIAQLNSLEEIKQENPVINIASHLIRCVFIIIDVAPVLIKMLTPYSIYDEAVHQEKKCVFHELDLNAKQYCENATLESVITSEMSWEAIVSGKQSPKWQTMVEQVGQKYVEKAGDRLMENNPKQQKTHSSTDSIRQENNDYVTRVKSRKNTRSAPKNNVIDAFKNTNQYPSTNEHL